MTDWEPLEPGVVRCPHCTHKLMDIGGQAYARKARPSDPPPDYGGNVKCPACRKHYLYQQEKVA